MGNPIGDNAESVTYKGAKYSFCCPGCHDPFAKSPETYIRKAVSNRKTIGEFLFDPITGKRIQTKSLSSDLKGLRFYFSSNKNKRTFDLSPAKYATIPSKENLTCAVMGSKIENPSKADSYADYQGVRYYFCCSACPPKFKGNEASYAKSSAKTLKAAKVF